jgi:hypothetical protein
MRPRFMMIKPISTPIASSAMPVTFALVVVFADFTGGFVDVSAPGTALVALVLALAVKGRDTSACLLPLQVSTTIPMTACSDGDCLVADFAAL